MKYQRSVDNQINVMSDNNGIKVRDAVCGMLLDLGDEPVQAEYNGESYFFCSKFCKSRFEADPQKYSRENQ